jgi:hypothetical protein
MVSNLLLSCSVGVVRSDVLFAICADARTLANASLRQRQGRTQTQQRFAIALAMSACPYCFSQESCILASLLRLKATWNKLIPNLNS